MIPTRDGHSVPRLFAVLVRAVDLFERVFARFLVAFPLRLVDVAVGPAPDLTSFVVKLVVDLRSLFGNADFEIVIHLQLRMNIYYFNEVERASENDQFSQKFCAKINTDDRAAYSGILINRFSVSKIKFKISLKKTKRPNKKSSIS